MKKQEIVRCIDQTLLAPDATEEQMRAFCEKAKEYRFWSVCVNPRFVPQAKEILAGSDTRVCTVIDFPLGAGGTGAKIAEAGIAIANGADELDFVVDLALVKGHKWEELGVSLSSVIKSVREAPHKVLTKLILETCLLTDDEIVQTCLAAKEARFDFVKTSTGFSLKSPNGATVHAVSLMRKTVGDGMGVKASGGIRTTEQALAFLAAGASRLGCSAGVAITDGLA